MATIPLRHDIDYPESDGQPMGETEFHRDEMLDLIAALKDRFLEAADVYMAGNLFLYYVEGDRRAVVCPDVFQARRVARAEDALRAAEEEVARLRWELEGRKPG